MKKAELFVASFTFLFLAACGPAEPESELAAIRKARQLVITTTGVNIPFSYVGGSGVQGFDIDLGNAIAEKLNVRPRWVRHSFAEHFDLVQHDKVDLAIANITITEERKQRVAFSEPYFTSGQILATRKENKQIKSIADLAGKKLGVHGNTTSERFAREDESASKAQIELFDNIDAALLALNGGAIDAVIGDFPIVISSVRASFPRVHVVGDTLTTEQYGVVVKQSEAELLRVVNDTIAESRQSGKYDEMVRRWFGNKPDVMRLIQK